MIKFPCLLIMMLMIGSSPLLAQAKESEATQTVRVGAAHFPPYVVRPEKSEAEGLLPELLASLNQSQRTYTFVFVPTSVTRRFRDFEQGRVDVALFENPDWGWQQIAHDVVDMGLEDEEIFVAKHLPGRQQDFFADLSDKHLALFSGYHYGFAGYNADPNYLMSHFNAALTYSHESNLLMVSRGRVDIAPMTRSFLKDAMARHIVEADELLVSERVDQVYRHYALVRPGGPIDAIELNQLLQRLRTSGELTAIFKPFDVRVDTQALPTQQRQAAKAR